MNFIIVDATMKRLPARLASFASSTSDGCGKSGWRHSSSLKECRKKRQMSLSTSEPSNEMTPPSPEVLTGISRTNGRTSSF
jgi:hypothetical protein